MDKYSAACAIAQLDRINYLLKYKLKIYQLYKKYFSRIKNVEITKELKNQKQTFWIVYAIINKKIDKENFCNKFKKYKIDMRPMFFKLVQCQLLEIKKCLEKTKLQKKFLKIRFVFQMDIILMKKKLKKYL